MPASHGYPLSTPGSGSIDVHDERGGEGRLAFVGSNQRLNTILIAMLRAGGLQVYEPGSNVAGLSLLKKHNCIGLMTTLDTSEVPGVEILDRIKNEQKDFPVFVVIERQATDEELELIKIADRIFERPLKGSAMVEAIRKTVGSHGRRDSQ